MAVGGLSWLPVCSRTRDDGCCRLPAVPIRGAEDLLVIRPTLSAHVPTDAPGHLPRTVYLVVACDGSVTLTERLDRARAEYSVELDRFRHHAARDRTVDLLTL